jgi:hypothetical protein
MHVRKDWRNTVNFSGSIRPLCVPRIQHFAAFSFSIADCLCWEIRIMSFATGEVAAILKRPELYLTDLRPMIVIAMSGICSL